MKRWNGRENKKRILRANGFSRKRNQAIFFFYFCLKEGKNYFTVTDFSLVSLFNGLSTFIGYLMPKPSF